MQQKTISIIGKGVLNSYSIIFFSDNRIFALLLMLVTFFDAFAGLSGIIAVLISNLVAYGMGYSEENISKGFYGFNSLLVGLGLGITFEPNVAFYILLAFSALFTLFISITLEGVIGKYGLPFLSIPFLLVIWLFFLATRHYHSLLLSNRSLLILSDVFSTGGISVAKQYYKLENLPIHDSLIIYFKSLGAIFFQYSVLAGLMVAIGILIYSRIAFTLSLIGFYAAYLFYFFIGANILDLSYNYIGFNFILTAIAIGGFFIVPSVHSYQWVVVLIPSIAILTTGSSIVMSVFKLSIYSLPFNIIVLSFLYVLKFRTRSTLQIQEVIFQQNSPELNLYSQMNNQNRFKNAYFFPVSLPFWGSWYVSQGHNGNITHQGEWKNAWDFVIKDDKNKSFKMPGLQKEDFYSYNKPVISPADGVIEDVIDNIEDNEIGDVNLNENWGNTIVIKHAPTLYSKICHLKKDSSKFKKGDAIRKGDVIAFCGNSGRSPEPHIHFQLQATPFIDSRTLDFPISYFVNLKKNELLQFDRPKEHDLVSNIENNVLLFQAFHFIPGKKMKYLVSDSSKAGTEEVVWEIQTDYYNNSFIYCHNTHSKAFFTNDGNILFFRHFTGDKKSLLFYFFMAAYKVMMGFYKDITIQDQYPVQLLNNKLLLFFQDFIAPFYMFIKANYTIKYDHIDDPMTSGEIILKSTAQMKIGNILRKSMDFELEIKEDRIAAIIVKEKNNIIRAQWVS